MEDRMPDCSAMQITIGGALPRTALGDLAAAILKASLGPDWDSSFDDEAQVIAHIETIIANRLPLTLHDDTCPGGMVTDLEALCRQLGLTYHRCDDGHYAYSAMHAAWQPGLEQPVELYGTIESGPCVPLDELSQAHWEAVAEVILRYEVFLACVPPLTLREAAELPSLVEEDRQ
jgi:hypothetical protein